MIPALSSTLSRRPVLGCLLALVTFLLTTCQDASVAPSERLPGTVDSSVSLSDWMSTQNPDSSLSALSIPGTHDTASTHEPFGGTAACQTLSLAEQLAIGVRFLDIRCRHVRNSFTVYHGVVDQHLSFAQVLAICRQFLADHPAEAIIMSIKEEYEEVGNTRSFAQTFDAYVVQDQNLWYLDDDLPTLRHVAGKIVLFRRFAAAGPLGLDASFWLDNRTFTITATAAPMRVQDHYVVPDTAAKWIDIRALLEEARTGDPQMLFVNFTSGYRPSLLGIPDIPVVSNDVHDRLARYFKDQPTGRWGVVLLDFAYPGLCAAIISSTVAPPRIP